MTISDTDMAESETRFKAEFRGIRPAWMIALGVLTMLTGIAAIAFPLASSLAVEVMTGSLFLTVGLFTTMHAVIERKAEGMWWELLAGLIQILAGVMLLANPLGGIIALTVLLGVTFIAEGVLRIIMAMQMERSKRLFLWVASGALSILLGGIVLAGLANGASLVVIGVFLGINFIFSGAASIAVGVAGVRSGEDTATG